MPAPLLQMTGVAKSFGAVRALKDVSFELRPGEVHALLGENGAGKSTLVRIITGAHRPDRGTVEIHGAPARHLTPALARRLGVACIYQQPALFPDLSVAENIALRLEAHRVFHRVRWGEQRARARALLDRIGANLAPDAEVRSLSMPEQQLVEIACALGTNARIVIMDEPTASLTARETGLLFKVVRDLRAAGAGVIYISHRLEEIFQLADRVTVLRDGETVGIRDVHPGPPAPGAPETLTPAELIRLMVGRDVAPPAFQERGAPGEVVLALRDFGASAVGVSGVTLEVRAGELVGLAGLVGAGRTELAHALFGLAPGDRGEMWLHGRRVAPRSPAEAVALGIGYVPEDRRRHGVVLELAVAANLTLAVLRRLFPGGWLRPAAERSLALEFLRDLEIKAGGPESPAASLSGGNQQKVALGRWLAVRPRLLILDEPTQGVDVGAKSEIHQLVRRLAADGLAVLLLSSDLPEVLALSDRIGVMRGGTLAALLPGGSSAQTVMTAALG